MIKIFKRRIKKLSSKSIKLFALTLVLVFAFGVVALAQETESVTSPTPLPIPRLVEGRPLVLGVQSPGLTSESSQRNWIQAQIEAEERGWKIVANIDVIGIDLQRAGLENLINQDVDAILLWYHIMEGCRDLVIKAREKGIGVYLLDTELRDGAIINPTQPNGVVGAKMTYYGLGRLKEVGNVLILNSMTHILRQRCFAAQGLIANEWPALELLGFENMKNPGWEKDSFDITQNYLTKYDNDLQWIFAGWDTPGIVAARAVEEAGLTRDDLFITGIDGGTQAYAEIRKGSPFTATMSQPFEEYCHISFEVINQVQIEGIAPGAPGSMVPDTRIIYVEPVLTNPENVPDPGTNIHELFTGSYYDPDMKDAWYYWGEPYKVQ